MSGCTCHHLIGQGDRGETIGPWHIPFLCPMYWRTDPASPPPKPAPKTFREIVAAAVERDREQAARQSAEIAGAIAYAVEHFR